MDYRENFFKIFLGHNRTGKSVLARIIATKWKKTHPKKNIIAYDPQNRFKDIKTVDITSFNIEQVNELLLNTYDSLVIIDDFRILYESDKTPSELLNFLQYRNERCNDVIFITHSPSLVQNRLTYYVTHFYLFYTQTTDKGFSDKLNNGIVLIHLSKLINEYVKEYGKGTYNEQNPELSFPYIVFDNENENIFLQNLTFKKY